MKLIVISKEVFFSGEDKIVNQLFESGLDCLHLRKPKASKIQFEAFLEKINPEFYGSISLHNFHSLSNKYHINRLHFSEKGREETSLKDLKKLRSEGNILSTSVHNLIDIKNLKGCFDYAFFSPVFDSISKPGYPGVIKDNFYLSDDLKSIQTLALGGINLLNIKHIKRINFDGAAILGALWEKPDKSIEVFTKFKKVCKKHEPM